VGWTLIWFLYFPYKKKVKNIDSHRKTLEKRDQDDNNKPRREISEETILSKTLMFWNNEENQRILLNDSLHKLIELFRGHLRLSLLQLGNNRGEWHEISLALKAYTARRIGISYWKIDSPLGYAHAWGYSWQ
jgi:hypothetical protein